MINWLLMVLASLYRMFRLGQSLLSAVTSLLVAKSAPPTIAITASARPAARNLEFREKCPMLPPFQFNSR